MLLMLALVGCASGPEVCLTRTEVERFPQPVFIRIPGKYTEPLKVDPLPEQLAGRDLEADIRHLEEVIDQAQADREQLRQIQQRRDALEPPQ